MKNKGREATGCFVENRDIDREGVLISMFSLFRKLDKLFKNHAKQRVEEIGPSGVDFGCFLVDVGLMLGQ